MKLLSIFYFAVWVCANSVLATDRAALVIGNSGYQTLPKLPACERDAKLIADIFSTKLGISIHGGKPLTDLTAGQMDDALHAFAAKLGPETEAYLYFSGHGVQADGVNYLLPVDYSAKYKVQLKRQAISLDDVLAVLEESKAKLRVIILDSCRSPGEFLQGEPAEKGFSRKGGLAEQKVENPDTLVCFATKHGTPAFSPDAFDTTSTSLYTSVLAQEILKPGKIEDVLKNVAIGVYAKTEKQQLPFTYGSLLHNFSFLPGSVPVIARQETPMTKDPDSTPGLESRKKISELLAPNDSAMQKKIDKSETSAVSTLKPGLVGWEIVHYNEQDYVSSASIHHFYQFAEHKVEGSNVSFTSPVLVMKGVIGSQNLLINDIKFVLSYPLVKVNGQVLISRLDLCKLIDPVLRPSYINSSNTFDTVIVDSGHGGHDSGARGIYGYEKDFALKLALELKTDLEKRGLKVVMTRSDDTFISPEGRVEFANKIPNSIFISLQFNRGESGDTGFETFALTPQGASSSESGAGAADGLSFSGNQRDSENVALATAVHASTVHHFKMVDRGVKRARMDVLKGLERPGVVFVGGFVTNPNDGRLIAAKNFREELAHTIGDAISNYRRALQPRVK